MVVIRLGFFFSVVVYETIGYIHKDKLLILLSGGLGELTDPESVCQCVVRPEGKVH